MMATTTYRTDPALPYLPHPSSHLVLLLTCVRVHGRLLHVPARSLAVLSLFPELGR